MAVEPPAVVERKREYSMSRGRGVPVMLVKVPSTFAVIPVLPVDWLASTVPHRTRVGVVAEMDWVVVGINERSAEIAAAPAGPV